MTRLPDNCPIHAVGSPELPTIKQRALQIMEGGVNYTSSPDTDSLTLQQLKLETDSRMAILIGLITDTVMTGAVEDGLTQLLLEGGEQRGSFDLIEDLHDVGERFF